MGKFAEFQLADMLAKEMFSWITGPVGIFAEAHELTVRVIIMITYAHAC
jgi:hypothetical protein